MRPFHRRTVFMDSLVADDHLAPSGRARGVLWVALVALVVAALAVMVQLAFQYRTTRTEHAVEIAAAAGSNEISARLAHDLQQTLALLGSPAADDAWRARAGQFLAAAPERLRVERRDAALRVVAAVDSLARPPLFPAGGGDVPRVDTELACAAAMRRAGPSYSDSYFVAQPDEGGFEVIDLCFAERSGDQPAGYVVVTIGLSTLLDQLAVQTQPPGYELALVDSYGSRIAHGRLRVGAGVYRASALVNVPGTAMQLQLNSAAARPSVVPDLVTGLVIGLSLALLGVLMLLLVDVRKRARAESALAEALAFRKAMEDSVVTGLRARDLAGRTTYVNPAFCKMVGFGAGELIGVDPPPYWPPDDLEAYQQRRASLLAAEPWRGTRKAFETTFVRKDGERFPAMVFEAPLLSASGRHTGWMSAVLDLSAQRRVEAISRLQQERLQATSRLASVGEMASLLSHELNQPLSAISAYAAGSLNMMDSHAAGDPEPELLPLMHQAIQRIAEQADRAGRVIKSVHDFVRRRDSAREAVAIGAMISTIEPLVVLQAQKSGTRIEVDLCTPAPLAICDRAMVEQVLLNLTRNGIQAMQPSGAGHDRVLTIRVRRPHAQWVGIAVRDTGPGISDEVARKLFTPFYTTRPEGMGLGLSVCRTIVEQHGGALVFTNLTDADGKVLGAEFAFTLPAAPAAA